MKRISFIFFSLLFLSHLNLHSGTQGSDTSVKTLNFFTFSGTNNRIANYGWVENGFAFQNASTTATFDSVFPVSGPVNLNGGTLTLNHDLFFNNTTTLQGLGTIVGGGHVLSFCQSCTALPNTQQFQDTKIFLNNDVALSSAITCSGSCLINGNGHRLILGLSGQLITNGTLILQNVILQGVSGQNVRCSTPASVLYLDNAVWIQTANATFSTGSFQCRNNVCFTGNGKILAYQTNQTSVIGSNSNLLLDSGFTFSYDPASSSASLLSFVDNSSLLIMNNSLLYTSTVGLKLTKGSMVVSGDSVFSSATKQVGLTIVDNGITLGDGLSVANDFAGDITTGAQLKVVHGSLNYKNVGSSSWLMENSISQLYLGPSTTLRLYKSLNLGTGEALCDVNAVIARVSNAQLIGSVSAIGNLLFEQF